MSAYSQRLTASETPSTYFINSPRWYVGRFKESSRANFRAVSRVLSQMLTKNRDNL